MNIVLVEPTIPQNTGSIARTCAATRTTLHLVGKLGFDISEKAVRRAGLDYWPYVSMYHHHSWKEFYEATLPQRCWYFTKFATKPYYEAKFEIDDYLVFGSETKGLGEEFLKRCPQESLLSIPMDEKGVRSLNLSNAVSIGLFEARRQIALEGLSQ
ncbi:MAG: tRNA (cytidine(34)-2'-O)-methyltransferase [Bdellovibrionota bacterium]|jgi:tRNA (cytidine/uridine-2'-O-)-methyltransferase